MAIYEFKSGLIIFIYTTHRLSSVLAKKRNIDQINFSGDLSLSLV